jgi:hypothetical protein
LLCLEHETPFHRDVSIPLWAHGADPEDSRTEPLCAANNRLAVQGSVAGHGRIRPDHRHSRFDLSGYQRSLEAVV